MATMAVVDDEVLDAGVVGRGAVVYPRTPGRSAR